MFPRLRGAVTTVLSIAFEDIPEGGIELADELDREWLVPLVGPQFFPADTPVRAEFYLARTGPSVVAKGKLTGRMRFVCSRCAEEAPWEVSVAFTHVFVKGQQAGAIPEGFDDPGSLEFTFFDGETVELEPLASEELVLSLPRVPLCSEACKGICQSCGKNLNEGPCSCHTDVVDPRWAKLRDIKL
jgi:uncharacterized protein